MNFNRSTTRRTAHAIENIISRGGTADLARLYQEAQRDPKLRSEIRRRLPLVDPELAPGAARLWAVLISRLDNKSSGPSRSRDHRLGYGVERPKVSNVSFNFGLSA
jgi:hypothetical protein